MGGGTALGSLWVQAKVYGKGNAVSSCKGHVVGLHDGGRLLTLIGALVGQKAYGSVCTHLGGGHLLTHCAFLHSGQPHCAP